MTVRHDHESAPVAAEPQTSDKGGVGPEALELRRARHVLAQSHRHPAEAQACRCDHPLMLADEGEPACARCGRTPR